MKKKYTTSLKLLLDDQSNYLNEGMSSLSANLNFSAQKAAKCEIDIPYDIRQKALEYIEGAKAAADRDADAKKRAALAKKGEDPTIMPAAITNLLDYTQSFFGGAAKSLLGNEQNWEEFQKMLNMFYFNNAPAVYCDILNSIMKRLSVIIRALDASKPRDTGFDSDSTITINADELTLIPLHEKYASDVILPKIFKNSSEYNNKLLSYRIEFFRSQEGRHMSYAMLHFENFSKEKLLNDKFDVNYLKEDIINLQEIINEITGRFVDTSSVTSAFIEIADITDYSRKIKSAVNEKESTLEQFDNENEDDDSAGKKAHQFFVNEYINYLLTVIQKIFYDKKLFNIMSNDCKDNLKQFANYLNSKIIN